MLVDEIHSMNLADFQFKSSNLLNHLGESHDTCLKMFQQ